MKNFFIKIYQDIVQCPRWKTSLRNRRFRGIRSYNGRSHSTHTAIKQIQIEIARYTPGNLDIKGCGGKTGFYGKFISKTEVEDVTVVTAKKATHIMLGGQYMDSKSRPHQIVWHIPDHIEPVEPENPRAVWARQESSYHHYWRDEQGNWHSNLLPGPVGNRAKLFLDADDNAYAAFMVSQNNEYKFNIYFNNFLIHINIYK